MTNPSPVVSSNRIPRTNSQLHPLAVPTHCTIVSRSWNLSGNIASSVSRRRIPPLTLQGDIPSVRSPNHSNNIAALFSNSSSSRYDPHPIHPSRLFITRSSLRSLLRAFLCRHPPLSFSLNSLRRCHPIMPRLSICSKLPPRPPNLSTLSLTPPHTSTATISQEQMMIQAFVLISRRTYRSQLSLKALLIASPSSKR